MRTLARIARFAALALALLAGLARAGMSPDPTGLWFDPAQPGWGIDVAQQGDTVFAIVFTYDAAHKPVWYVASNMQALSASEASGTLYRATGPAFTAATFDPRAVTATAVGQLDIRYASAAGPRSLAVNFSVDGVQFSRTIQAQSWSNDISGLLGSYGGRISVTLAPGSSALCPSPSSVTLLQPLQPAFGFSVMPSDTPGHVRFGWGAGIDVACIADAAYARDGQLATLSGQLACGPVGFPLGSPGPLVAIGNMTLNPAGFSGTAHIEATVPAAGTCVYDGTFGGVLTKATSSSGMNPDPSGVWFNPDESGWGVILTQQGPTTFAALFGYDANGQATWWAASNVVDSGHGVNFLVQEAFSGALYRTTGPYFGNAGDTTALAATAVGTLQVAYIGGTDKLALSYTIDGNAVNKTLQRETWSSNFALLSGDYTGGLFPDSNFCPSAQFLPPVATTFTVAPGSSPSTVRVTWSQGTDNSCAMDVATYAQTGQLASLTGGFRCGPLTDPQAHSGTISISSMSVSPQGFAGFGNFTVDGCTSAGFIGGVKR